MGIMICWLRRRINENTIRTMIITVVPSKKDKLLYLVEHNRKLIIIGREEYENF